MGAPGPTALSRLQSLSVGAGETDGECSGQCRPIPCPSGQLAAPASAEWEERRERRGSGGYATGSVASRDGRVIGLTKSGQGPGIIAVNGGGMHTVAQTGPGTLRLSRARQ